MRENELTAMVIDAAVNIHKRLGPGLLESVYEAILAYELRRRGLDVASQMPIPVRWGDIAIEIGFRADLIVNETVLIELKSIEALAPVHKKQVLTYLKVGGFPVGLLLNFGEKLLKDGIVRIVNGLADDLPPT